MVSRHVQTKFTLKLNSGDRSLHKYSMANLELTYFVTDVDLNLFHIAFQPFLPNAHAGSVSLAIWNSNPRLQHGGVTLDLTLYTPKRPISVVSTEEFKNDMSELLDQDKHPRLEALNGPLAPGQKLSDLWPSGPDENVLQLIVVPGILYFTLCDTESRSHISSSPPSEASTLKRI